MWCICIAVVDTRRKCVVIIFYFFFLTFFLVFVEGQSVNGLKAIVYGFRIQKREGNCNRIAILYNNVYIFTFLDEY